MLRLSSHLSDPNRDCFRCVWAKGLQLETAVEKEHQRVFMSTLWTYNREHPVSGVGVKVTYASALPGED